MIPEDVITRIREAASIREVVGQYVQLKRAGRNWKGLCPFHGEKTPSFQVLELKQFFHCFGCQKHGDVFTFVMELEGKSFVEAAEQLAGRYGVELPKIEENPELKRVRGERHAMHDLNKLVAAFFREQLAKADAPRAYLAKRGVGDEVSEKFQLGYAPNDWHVLADHLRDNRVDLELAVKVGLLRRQPRAGGYYDMYRDRIVCPVIEPGGQIAGFSARVIGKPPAGPDGSEPPKYINSPESVVYKKSKLLFGLAQAREAMQQHKRVVLVEGNFDVITLHQAGFGEVVAPLGTALTTEQVGKLKRMTDRVVLLYDGDRAGYKATMHALQTCVEQDVEVQVARRLADGVDPDSLVAGGGADKLREGIDRALGGIEFFCFEVWGKARANADARARALEEAAKLAVKVATPIKRDLIVDTLAKALGVDLGVVRNAVARASGDHRAASGPARGSQQRPTSAPTSETPVALLSHEVEIFTLLADHPTLITSSDADKAFCLLTDTRLRAMYSAARAGQTFLELAPVLLPTNTAKEVLSGKYAKAPNPAAQLAAMMHNLEIRRATDERDIVGKQLDEVKRTSDHRRAAELARSAILHNQLVVALTSRDFDRADQLRREIQSNRKQVD